VRNIGIWNTANYVHKHVSIQDRSDYDAAECAPKFGAAFWNISKIISYERNIKTYMIISGWGIFLIFAANQTSAQMLTPYPPFGLATITVLATAAYLMLIGIYNSATLVTANNELRRSIYKHASEIKLLGMIGQAEMEKEIQKTVKQVTIDKYDLDKHLEEPV